MKETFILQEPGHYRIAAFWKESHDEVCVYHPDYFHNKIQKYKTNPLKTDDDIKHAAVTKFGVIINDEHMRKIYKSKLSCGRYFRRVWRGIFRPMNPNLNYNPIHSHRIYQSAYTNSLVASESLFLSLREIFKNIEPSTNNLNTYSHKIRELLILACTEIEASWKAVLIENSSKKESRYKTNHYFKTKDLLKLDKWSVHLKDYEHLGVLTPFKDWNETNPTRSLEWYDSYNAVKHDREGEFERANLKNLLNAMAAMHILLCAQWGPQTFHLLYENRYSPFHTNSIPDFSLADLYVADTTETFQAIMYFDDPEQFKADENPEPLFERLF
ncbi:hypothetical protein [Chromobacterium paludis]|uniref:Uncharacterized protein n=1 Tax=Chromobacterium paludis TaxID=2605945 RepID=A0A5C1DJJ6_9NEIS|nr:hypothetical protein [Chromobacterium paludis]QEL56743.1 hypothetical protein FYK34_14825 [Chromobacterium paludis]